ncbi:PIG-U-domain-containing protein [Peniophora sp. CONT]|nr:PIG-U-domain-containing protein [Peniophora sp. CONT]
MNTQTTLGGLLAAKFLLALTPFGESLQENQILTSPLNAYPRLREGIYLFEHGIDPYSGGTFRHSPLFLSLFAWLPPWRILNALLWTAADAIAVWALASLWTARSGGDRSRTGLIGAVYLANPYLLLPSLASATSSFDNALILISLKYAAEHNASPSLLALAAASHLSLPAVLLLPPILLLLASDPHSHLASPKPFSNDWKRAAAASGEFVVYFAVLVLASSVVAGGLGWTHNTWGANFLLPDLTPNPGLWWYFFTEMFDDFRPFFLMVFSMHLLIYVVPICLKFQHDPLYGAFLLTGVIATFKSYPTLADPGLFLSMSVVFPEVYQREYPIVTTLLHLHAALLMPLFHHLWVSTGTGNANFFYASTLVFGLANGGALLDFIWAGLRIAVGEVPEECSVAQE